MLRTIYRLLLSLSATSWFILVFLVKYLFELDIVYYCVTIAGCLIASIVITMIGLKLSKKLDVDNLNDYNELELVDNEGVFSALNWPHNSALNWPHPGTDRRSDHERRSDYRGGQHRCGEIDVCPDLGKGVGRGVSA